MSYASATLYQGAIAIGEIISSGGQETVSGGTISGTMIENGTELLLGGTAVNVTVSGNPPLHSAGGSFNLGIGSVATNTVVENGGTLYAGGIASGVTVGSGGGIFLEGGTIVNDVLSGGSEDVNEPGKSGVLETGTIIEAGGEQALYAGTVASAVVNSGGSQYVTSNSGSGGIAINTHVNSAGTQTLFYGGVTNRNHHQRRRKPDTDVKYDRHQ